MGRHASSQLEQEAQVSRFHPQAAGSTEAINPQSLFPMKVLQEGITDFSSKTEIGIQVFKHLSLQKTFLTQTTTRLYGKV